MKFRSILILVLTMVLAAGLMNPAWVKAAANRLWAAPSWR